MSHLKVRQTIEPIVAQFCTTNSISFVGENVKPGTDISYPYVMVYELPSRTVSGDLAGEWTTYSGIFQVTIVDRYGNAAGAVNTLAEQLRTLFPPFKYLDAGQTVLVTAPIAIGKGLPEGEIYSLPVSIEYRCDIL